MSQFNLLSDNYSLNLQQKIAFPLFSAYSIRHFQEANKCYTWKSWSVQVLTGLVELIPILGAVASICEYILYKRNEPKPASNENPFDEYKVPTELKICIINSLSYYDAKGIPFVCKEWHKLSKEPTVLLKMTSDIVSGIFSSRGEFCALAELYLAHNFDLAKKEEYDDVGYAHRIHFWDLKLVTRFQNILKKKNRITPIETAEIALWIDKQRRITMLAFAFQQINGTRPLIDCPVCNPLYAL